MNPDKNKIIEIGAITFLVVLFLGSAVYMKPKPMEQVSENVSEQSLEDIIVTSTEAVATSTTSTENKTNTVKKPIPTKTTAPGAVTQSYSDALKEYSASGYRFQFVDCRATPGILTIKKGATFMLDNRDNKAHKIKVGASTYSIGAYGFAVATAKTVGLNYIICDDISTGRLQVEP